MTIFYRGKLGTNYVFWNNTENSPFGVTDIIVVNSPVLTASSVDGPINALNGLSGSLQTLSNGSPYILAGTNITVITNSFGQVEITSSAISANPGGSNGQIQYNNSGSFGGLNVLTFTNGNLFSTGSFKGTLDGTSSLAINSLTASYVLQAISSSFASIALTASYILNAVSSSYATSALTASYAINAGNAMTASYVLNAISASFATSSTSAITASYVLNAVSASFATNALTASFIQNALSSSFSTSALTASYVLNAVSSSYANTSLSSSYASNADLLDNLDSTAFARLSVGNIFTGNTTFTGSVGYFRINVTNTADATLILSGTDTKGGAGYFNFLYVSNSYSASVNRVKNFRLANDGTFEIISSDYNTNIFALSDAGNLTIPGGYLASKASSFFGVKEKFNTKAGATGTIVHDCSTGHIFYHSGATGNWTSNFTNLSMSNGYATTITLVVTQSSNAYIPSAIQLDGVGQTLNWQGNVTPTGTANRRDVISFSILNVSSSYVVLGQFVSF